MSLRRYFSARPALCSVAVCTVLFVGTVLVFSRALGYGFSNYDDPHFVTGNVHVQAGLTWKSIVWAFTAQNEYWHPLTWLSHMLDWRLYGENATGHHLTSVLWHALNAVLAFLVLRRLTGSFWTSAISAALFAWHPLRVESVVWVAERKDVLSGFFFLLTLWSYSIYAERRQSKRRAGGFYVLTLALFVGGLMSKSMLVTLPAVLLLLDFWPLRQYKFSPPAIGKSVTTPLAPIQQQTWPGLVYEKLPLFALSAATAIITLSTQQETGAFTLNLPLDARAGNSVVSVVRYLGKFAWPFDLTAFYPHQGYWSWWAVAGSAIAVAGLTVAAWTQRRVRPWLLTGWLLFLVMLLPVSGLIQVGFQSMADRYTYLPIIGVQLALLWTLREIALRPAYRVAAGVLAGAILAGCVVQTWHQQATWRDSVTLLEHAIAVTERNDTAHAFLGYALLNENRIDDAARHCERALEINPQNSTALVTLAGVRTAQGRIEESIVAYRDVLRLKPEDANAQFALASTLSRLGRVDEALAHYQTTVKLQPSHAQAQTEIGFILLDRGQPAEALQHFRDAIKTSPDLGVAFLGLGRAAGKLGYADEAATSFERAVALTPDDPDAQIAWAETLMRRKQFAVAVPYYEQAVKLQPDNAGAHAGLGYALFLSNQREAAIAQWEEALRLDPNFPDLRKRLEQIRR